MPTEETTYRFLFQTGFAGRSPLNVFESFHDLESAIEWASKILRDYSMLNVNCIIYDDGRSAARVSLSAHVEIEYTTVVKSKQHRAVENGEW